MVHVDRVWAEIPFRTPWSGERERAEARAALERFLARHRRPGARTLLATEQPLRAEVRLPDGSSVVVDGRADRLELDDEGRVVVVDLKTGKYPPSGKDLPEHPQLGLYQLAVQHGAVDDLLPAEAVRDAATGSGVPGGAELWQLRHQAYGKLKVQPQAPQEPDDDGQRPVERQLADAVAVVRDESFPTRPGDHCKRCDFATMCPAQVSGTVLT
jgi:RecB family exonuclease